MAKIKTLSIAVAALGGLEATGKVCGVTGQAVSRWLKRGKLPRTEYTGETHYADLMEAANPNISAIQLRLTGKTKEE